MDNSRAVELDLIRRLQQGSADAFDALYDKFGDSIWRLCFRMSRNSADAEDLAQEVWFTVWHKVGTFRCESGFQTWLYKVASNVCLQWIRKNHDRAACPIDDACTDKSPGPETDAIAREGVGRLLAAMAGLPDTLRLPLVLRVDEELSYAEIAEVLGCTTASVKMRIARARAALAGKMEEEK
jgi:RNA polymerase sigma-70 factor, ECF subfamily